MNHDNGVTTVNTSVGHEVQPKNNMAPVSAVTTSSLGGIKSTGNIDRLPTGDQTSVVSLHHVSEITTDIESNRPNLDRRSSSSLFSSTDGMEAGYPELGKQTSDLSDFGSTRCSANTAMINPRVSSPDEAVFRSPYPPSTQKKRSNSSTGTSSSRRSSDGLSIYFSDDATAASRALKLPQTSGESEVNIPPTSDQPLCPTSEGHVAKDSSSLSADCPSDMNIPDTIVPTEKGKKPMRLAR